MDQETNWWDCRIHARELSRFWGKIVYWSALWENWKQRNEECDLGYWKYVIEENIR